MLVKRPEKSPGSPLHLQCNKRNEMPYIWIAHVHYRFKHGATTYFSLNKLCSLVDRSCKLCIVNLIEADHLRGERHTVRKFTSWNPSDRFIVRGNEKQTRSGFFSAISSTITGTSRLPYFASPKLVPDAVITVSQKAIKRREICEKRMTE
jgi:hypothetical protein